MLTRSALILGLFASVYSFAQSGAVIPQGGVGHATQASCVILKRMGPADQVTSHLYSFGIRGKQFQYVEGKLPEGFPFHGRLTDHDVRNLQGRGAEVIILNSAYTSDELKQARDDCRGETGKSPNQAEPKAAPTAASTAAANESPTSARTDIATIPATSDKPAPPQIQAVGESNTTKLSVGSTPAGADIEVDGAFVGNTPSMLDLSPGDHTVTITKSGYKSWERKLKASGGNVNLNAELETAK
ncbi:MAG TPA: PEGA domain-containing protein [Terriglobales bacterium]|nr:PEGA domain-containing protein [Terriglobales bacterium]